jgi:hypothetical protein
MYVLLLWWISTVTIKMRYLNALAVVVTRIKYFNSSHLQLIVGSEDFDIRVFREDEIIAEMTETEVN